MRNKTILLAFLAPLAFGCPKSPGDAPSAPPPAPATHAATPVESPPPPAPHPPSGVAQPAGEPVKSGEAAAPPGHEGGPAIGPSRGTMVRGLKECVDAQLSQRKLNEFGDPEG